MYCMIFNMISLGWKYWCWSLSINLSKTLVQLISTICQNFQTTFAFLCLCSLSVGMCLFSDTFWEFGFKGWLWSNVHATQGGYGPLTSLRTLLTSTARAWLAPPKNCNLLSRRLSSKGCDWFQNPMQDHKGSLLRRSDCVVIVLRERGTIISPLVLLGDTASWQKLYNKLSCLSMRLALTLRPLAGCRMISHLGTSPCGAFRKMQGGLLSRPRIIVW